MRKYFAFFLFGFALVLCQFSCAAQAIDSSDYYDSVYYSQKDLAIPDSLESVKADTVLSRFTIDTTDNLITAYTNKKEFRYMRYLDSILRKTKSIRADTVNINDIGNIKKSRRVRVENSTESYSIFNNLFVKIFFWVLAIGFILFIVYKLFFGENLFKKNPAVSKPVAPSENETVTTFSEYDGLINDAITAKKYALAVRYLYLQTLQVLSSKGLINFSPDKTNYEYVKELSGNSQQNKFAALTLNYEYVWYGKFEIDKEIFSRIQKDFKQYHLQF